VNPRASRKLVLFGFLAVAMVLTSRLYAQHMTLEGQTGGFLTPTAYVVESEKGHVLSYPAIGFHFVNTAKVIGNVETVSITEGFANRAEIGYTRSIHQLGDSTVPAEGAFSNLWNYDGMNVFHGKVVLIKDAQFAKWVPGVAVGGVVRTGDKFVSGALNQELFGVLKTYSNGDVYAALTKTWAKKPVPFLVNFGLKFTNASIYGLGGQSTRFGGRLFGGIGIPLPGPWKTVIVPSAGFTQQPKNAVNLGAIMPFTGAHIPTTLDYAVRVTQREHPHFSFDIGVGQVAGTIGTAVIPTGLPSPYPPYLFIPVNLQARHVVGMGVAWRY